MVANYFASPQELRDRIEQTFIGAPSNRFHPVIQKIVDGEATLDHIRGFARQFWAIPKYNLAVCGGKASQLQPLPDMPYGTGQPYDMEVQKHFLHIVLDEAGTEVFPNAPTVSHYELYLRFSDALGIPRSEMERVDLFLPKVIVALHSWVDMARNLPLVESAIGMNWINETRSSRAGMALEPALRKHYGLSKEAAQFWSAHGEQDQEHSAIGPYLIEKYATTLELRERIWIAACRGAAIMQIILDSVWDEYFEPRRN